MKVIVAGTRGIPNIMGGVETHCEALYTRLVEQGFSITIARRSSYLDKNIIVDEYKGIKLVNFYSPKSKSLEAIIHSMLVVFYAKRNDYNYIHIHAIGPSLVIPFARILGLKVIMTHHGPDYDRQKWGVLAKNVLKLGEWCAAKFANEVIVISQTINNILKENYNRHDAHLIHNGVVIQNKTKDYSYIFSMGLEPKKYILAVGRLVPEKGFHDLIEAYKTAKLNFKLVIAGDADFEDNYSIKLKKQARKNGVVLTGFVNGEKLSQLYSHAALFVMPSYHEGLPIVLLEAMSYNLKLIVSNIPANIDVNLEDDDYFEVGDTVSLASKIKKKLANNTKINYQDILKRKYDWNSIAYQTGSVYNQLR